MKPVPTLYRILETPTGPMAILQDAEGGLSLKWVSGPDDPIFVGSSAREDLREDLAARLSRYFGGESVQFDDIPTPAGSPFFRQCWIACRRIPRGQTRSYAELARLAGAEGGSARAAGQAMRRNPLPIVVPCHRVVASSGELHGFAGSSHRDGPELGRKRHLLALEGAVTVRHEPTLWPERISGRESEEEGIAR